MVGSKAIETSVGAFLALGFAALLILAMKVSNLSFAHMTGSDTYTVTARFDNIGGLKVRSPVKLAGVTIGRVENISIDSDSFEAVAALSLYKSYDRIPEDSSAVIYTAGLLGEQYVSIQPGGEDVFLKQGDQITLTQSAVVLEQVIGRFLYERGTGD